MDNHIRRGRLVIALAAVLLGLGGCTVITVAGAAVGVAATVAGTAVDVTVGTVKLGAKAVGAIIPDGDEE
ncbi:MAG: hypothetical protein R3E87_25445 [Burkholderiaceae bacterium]